MIDAGELKREDFEGRIGDVFTLETQPLVELRLSGVVAWDAGTAETAREPFRLEFTGPAGLRMDQRIYRMAHPAAGVMELFLVQTGDSPDGSKIEAVLS